MVSAKRRALLEQYQEATTKLFELSRELATVAGSYEMGVWQKAWQRCEEASHICDDLRQQIAKDRRALSATPK